MMMVTRATFHGYAAALRMRPEWRVAFLVFQGGAPRVRTDSLTGGGQIYGHEFKTMEAPVIHGYSPGVNSATGGGQMPALPAYLATLYGGARGQGS